MIHLALYLFILIILFVHIYGIERKASGILVSSILIAIGTLVFLVMQCYYVYVLHSPIYIDGLSILEIIILFGGKILAYLLLIYGVGLLVISIIVSILKRFLLL